MRKQKAKPAGTPAVTIIIAIVILAFAFQRNWNSAGGELASEIDAWKDSVMQTLCRPDPNQICSSDTTKAKITSPWELSFVDTGSVWICSGARRTYPDTSPKITIINKIGAEAGFYTDTPSYIFPGCRGYGMTKERNR